MPNSVQGTKEILGGIFLLYLQVNIGREGGLDAYSAVLGAQLEDNVCLVSQGNCKTMKNGMMSKRKVFKINWRYQR